MQVQEHSLTVSRTARYATFGEPEGAKQVWFVVHGHGQLANGFIRYFAPLNDGATYIVAPEALSRFYISEVNEKDGEHSPGAKVGATWMTREDRVNEINDYVGYLDALFDDVFRHVDRASVDVFVLGFSQGVATVCRWADAGRARPDRLVLWGGFLPDDVDPAGRFSEPKLTIVVGESDDFATPERIVETEERLAAAKREYDIVRFDGGHHINQFVLKNIAGRGTGETA